MTVKFKTCRPGTPQGVPRRLERALIFGEALVNVNLPHMVPGILVDKKFLLERQQLGTMHIQRLEAHAKITPGIWRIEMWQNKVDPRTVHWSVLCIDEKRGSLDPTLIITKEGVFGVS